METVVAVTILLLIAGLLERRHRHRPWDAADPRRTHTHDADARRRYADLREVAQREPCLVRRVTRALAASGSAIPMHRCAISRPTARQCAALAPRG